MDDLSALRVGVDRLPSLLQWQLLTYAQKHEFEKFILNPKYRPLLVLIKAIRNGLVYGAKVRFPHALVMVFLFRPGTLREKIRMVYKATRQHALNLAKFAFL